MSPLKIRGEYVPLALPLIFASAGISCALYIQTVSLYKAGAVLFLILTLIFAIKPRLRSYAPFFLMVLIFFLFGLRLTSVLKPPPGSVSALLPFRGAVRGRVCYSVRNLTIRKPGEKMVLYYDGAPPPPGSLIEARGQFISPRPPFNPGSFDWKRHLFLEGVYGLGRVEEIKVIEKRFPGKFIGSIRDYTFLKINRYFRSPYREAVLSIFMGDPGHLPDERLLHFRLAGITHILAVSGLHVGLVFFIFYAFFSSPKSSLSGSLLLSLVMMWIFIMVSGARPSALRAGIMMSFASSGFILGNRGNIFNSLAAAALLILIFSPGLLFSAGFQLSFGAVFGIIYLGPEISRFTGKALGISAAAVLFILPVLGRSFYYLPLASPLVNLAVIPLASFSMASIFIFLGFSLFYPAGAAVYASAAEMFTGAILGIAAFVSRVPYAGITVPAPPVLLIVSFYIFLIAAGPLKVRFRRPVLVFSFFLAVSAFIYPYLFPSRYIASIKGPGSPSFIVKMGRGKPILFAGKGYINVRDCLNFIRSRGEMGIKDIYIVHPPFGGLSSVARLAGEGGVRKIYYPGESGSLKMWDDFIRELGKEKVLTAEKGKKVDYGGWEFIFTEPEKKYLDLRDNYMQGII